MDRLENEPVWIEDHCTPLANDCHQNYIVTFAMSSFHSDEIEMIGKLSIISHLDERFSVIYS